MESSKVFVRDSTSFEWFLNQKNIPMDTQYIMVHVLSHLVDFCGKCR